VNDFQVVVIGGGMAGLVAGYQLTRHGLRPLVLEAGDQIGGAVARHTVAGIELDAGAESFAVARPAVTDLLTDLGMAESIAQPSSAGAWVRHQAGTAPLPRAALLGIPSRPRAVDVRAVIGWSGAARASLDALLPPRYGAGTLGELVRRRMGSAVLHRLVEPVVGGVHSADPSLLETEAVAPGLTAALGSAGSLAGAVRTLRGDAPTAGSAVAGIRGGMAVLPAALAAAILAAGGEIRCGVDVLGLARADEQWRVLVAGSTGSRSAVTADAVMTAVPAASQQQLLGPLLGPGVLAADVPSTPVALVTVVLDDPRLDAAPRGSGILVAPRATGVRAKALTHATAKWPWLAETVPAGRHVLRLSYGRGAVAGGADAEPIAPDDQLPGIALADATELLGLELAASTVLGCAVRHWPASLPQARAGHTAAVAALRAAVSSYPGLAVLGSAVSGNGLAAVVSDSRAQADLLADSLRH
jgi:oxygen-dependent protoporphyrinogen oxidase